MKDQDLGNGKISHPCNMFTLEGEVLENRYVHEKISIWI